MDRCPRRPHARRVTGCAHAQRRHDRTLDAANRYQDGVVSHGGRVASHATSIRRRHDRSAARRFKHRDEQRNHDEDDPGTFEGLGGGDDEQDDARDDRAEPVDGGACPPAGRRERRQCITIPLCDSVNDTNTPIM